MADMNAAIIVLGPGALPLARRLRDALPGSAIHGARQRLGNAADLVYQDFGAHLRDLHARRVPIVALCAAGILIRALAASLGDGHKQDDPPVLAVAEDGSAVVPLLGGLGGAHTLARRLGALLGVAPAITASGELRFGTCLLNPPQGYVLADLEQGKHFVSDLLAGAGTRIEGEAPWLAPARLPHDAHAEHIIRITPQAGTGAANELRIHPRSVALALRCQAHEDSATLEQRIARLLAQHDLAPASVAVLVVPRSEAHHAGLQATAKARGMALRHVDSDAQTLPATWLHLALAQPHRLLADTPLAAVAIADAPIDVARSGASHGRLTVLGLGPGHSDFLLPAARHALETATDIVGYTPYVAMAGPLRPGQRAHPSDNREELARARHAFELAAQGRHVAVVSSGDPGIFAMAAAVLEILQDDAPPAWHEVDLRILPGVSAAMATAALAGAPLGHDFCLLSLSDHLKPWTVIQQRLRLAAEADLVLGFYNPISRQRPWQLDDALDIVRRYRRGDTPVVLGRDVGRPGEQLTTTTLQQLRSDMVDMRTVVIVGSSTTRRVTGAGERTWVYTPRWYPSPPQRP